MILRWLAISIVCSVFLGCDSLAEKHVGAVVLDEGIYEKYKDKDVVLGKKRNELMFEKGDKATTCHEYSELQEHQAVGESVNNMLVKSEYLICDVLNLLSQQHGVSYKSSMTDLGSQLGQFLDLRTFPNSLGRVVDDDHYTLSSFYANDMKSDGNTLVIDSEDWMMTFTVVAKIQARLGCSVCG